MLYEVITPPVSDPGLRHLARTSSTNDDVHEAAARGAPDGLAVWADRMTDVITSYSIHYTKLYEKYRPVQMFRQTTKSSFMTTKTTRNLKHLPKNFCSMR